MQNQPLNVVQTEHRNSYADVLTSRGVDRATVDKVLDERGYRSLDNVLKQLEAKGIDPAEALVEAVGSGPLPAHTRNGAAVVTARLSRAHVLERPAISDWSASERTGTAERLLDYRAQPGGGLSL